MNRKLLLLVFAILLSPWAYAQDRPQMEFKGELKQTKAVVGNLTEIFMSDSWPSDLNGDNAAIIRVKVTDMSVSEMRKLDVKGSPNLGLGSKQFLEKEQQWLLAVSAGSNMYLEMTHPTYGTSSRLNINETLKAKHIYDITLTNNKTATIVVRSIPEGASVYLDGDNKGKTPCEIPNQRLGTHNLRLFYEGNTLVETIEVAEGHTVFDKFDFRERTKIKITSDPSGSAIYVDNIMIGRAPINDYNIVLGAHTFKAELSAVQVDEQSINVTNATTVIELHPVKKSNVQITTKYSGSPVSARLVVDNEKEYVGMPAYNVELPYGSHTFRVEYLGKTREKTMSINKPQSSHVFKLSARNDFVMPWNREYDHHPAGFSIGYVSKQIVSTYSGERYKIDPGYFRENKSLSGMQMGFHFQPAFSWGLGLYFGLFYELYMAHDEDWSEDTQYFTEHALNVPAHLYFRLPLGRKCSLSVHGGVGADYGLYASYSKKFLGGSGDDTSTSKVYDNYYGEDNGGPGRFNATWDLGGSLNLGGVSFNAFMSKGFIKHKGVVTWTDNGNKVEGKTYVNKYGITMSFCW